MVFMSVFNGIAAELNDFGQETYGVDVSFPIQHATVSENYATLPHNIDPDHNSVDQKYKEMPVQPLGNKHEFYSNFMQGCRDFYGKSGRVCDSVERGRIEMGLRQPQSMYNYTELGFKKIRAPPEVYKLIQEFWKNNKDRGKLEVWSKGNTYTNNWDAPTKMVSVEDTTLRGAGLVLKQKLWDAAQNTLEEWTGEKLTPCSLYGVRIYQEGAVLATHVDRVPLVTSAIINVAQDVDEPWPIEVYAHDGKAYNVTMEPGDMVLYESHSVLHGRPFPLKGRFYANIFIHFEPVGHSLKFHGIQEDTDVQNQYRRAADASVGGHENDPHKEGLPYYLIPDSPEEPTWKSSHPEGWHTDGGSAVVTGSTVAHQAAIAGDIDTLKEIATQQKADLHKKDQNGWQPIHEGARAGHVHVVKLLVEHDANVNERSNHGVGGTPLHIAKQEKGTSGVIEYLESIGALDIGPDL